jgi:endoglucanase
VRCIGTTGRFSIVTAIALTTLASIGGAWGGSSHPGAATARESSAAPTVVGKRRPKGLHVAGNRLLDGKGRRVQFHGVNRSGTEYACVQGWGIFDGPSDATSVAAMATWHINAVRIPINEECWLGINGVKADLSGANYRRAIVNYVRLLHKRGMYAELALMWAAPGSFRAGYQPDAPNADHSPALWSSLASAFKNDHKVVLAPWGETTVVADCFLKGGSCGATFGSKKTPYIVAGMQQAVSVMRKAGYTGVIAIPGVSYANDLSKWLSHMPKDPRHQLIAEAHVYGKNSCDAASCFDSTYAPVARRVPLIFGETGETYDGSDCGSSYIERFLSWADAHHVGYESWTWDTWGNCSALIKDYAGTPFSGYGAWVRSHYRR